MQGQSPQKKMIPGYAGYIPKHHQFDDTTSKKVSNDPNKVIPGYQGHVPSVTAESLHGKTFGKISEALSKGAHSKGIRITPAERFKTSHMDTYKDPQQVRMPKYEMVEMKAVVDSGKKDNQLPNEAIHKFWGMDHPDDINKSAEKFF